MRLYSGPSLSCKLRSESSSFQVYSSSRQCLLVKHWEKGSRVLGKLVGMLDVQNVSLQMHAIHVHTQISMCFYNLFSDNLVILSDFVF